MGTKKSPKFCSLFPDSHREPWKVQNSLLSHHQLFSCSPTSHTHAQKELHPLITHKPLVTLRNCCYTAASWATMKGGQGGAMPSSPLFCKVMIFYTHGIYFFRYFLSISYSFSVKSFMLIFCCRVNKDLIYFPLIRVDSILHSLTSATSSSIMSSKRVRDFFKPKVSRSNEGMNTNLLNAGVEQENDAIWMKSTMKRLSSKKGKFSTHQNIAFFRKWE